MSARLRQIKDWYETNEKSVSTISLIAGFVFDSLTLQRIDNFRDNLWLSLNLLLVGTCIIFLNRQKFHESWKHFWLLNTLQFGLGNILGGFFILYFRSGTLSASWPFLILLLFALVANELFQKRYARLVLQLSFFYLAVFSFSIFLVPIFLHQIGPFVFILSGMASLLVFWLFILLLKKLISERFKESSRPLFFAVMAIFFGINVLYFANLIPPIPLSLKDAGIYQYLSRDSRGSYIIAEEKKRFMDYFSFHETIHLVPGDSLYAYNAIFSPTNLDTRIIHEWQYRDEETGKWLTAARIPLLLSGGRSGGFRTYSTKSNLTEGDWRVNIATPRGELLGRINFRIISASVRPPLIYQVKK
ncbi:MAG: DUF2914 domain-containing protein [Patescibacteria group bacterium]